MNFVFTKKCILPTGAPNVLQSLNMAPTFSRTGAKTYFFPGVKGCDTREREEVFRTVLENSGIEPVAGDTWSVLPGSHAGVYGLRFRLAAAVLRFTLPDAVFYARDIYGSPFP
jgi:hypothetical protein